jgi:hypothetical protein
LPGNSALALPSAGTMILSPTCSALPGWAIRVSPLRTICTPGLTWESVAGVPPLGSAMAPAAGCMFCVVICATTTLEGCCSAN